MSAIELRGVTKHYERRGVTNRYERRGLLGFGLGILLGRIVVSIGLGHHRFEASDL